MGMRLLRFLAATLLISCTPSLIAKDQAPCTQPLVIPISGGGQSTTTKLGSGYTTRTTGGQSFSTTQLGSTTITRDSSGHTWRTKGVRSRLISLRFTLASGCLRQSFSLRSITSPLGCLRQAVLVRILPRMSHPTGCYYAAYRANVQVAWFPASARWHVFMYAGFKRVAPEQDTGMDLNEPWITALELFNVRKRS
jgi:hypothetical protein